VFVSCKTLHLAPGTVPHTLFKKAKDIYVSFLRILETWGGGGENFKDFKIFPGIPTLQREVFYPASRKTLYFYSQKEIYFKKGFALTFKVFCRNYLGGGGASFFLHLKCNIAW
jgi:hypothetical protein